MRRPIAPDDGALVHRILGDPRVGPWHRPAGVEGPFSMGECDAFAVRHAAHWTRFGFGFWLISLAGQSEVTVAWGGAQHTEVGGRAEVEIGWSVAGSHWGRGIAPAIAHAALAATRARGLTGVVAYTRTDNHRSIRVMEKAGLRFERELEHGGWASVLYREP